MAASSKTKREQGKLSTPKTWRRQRAEEVKLPSGEVALLKRPGPAAFLTEGLLPDSLTPIVMKAVNTGRGLPPEKVSEWAQDPQKIGEMIGAMDKMLLIAVVQPPVMYHKRDVVDDEGKKTGEEDIPYDERDENYIYTDEVDFEDKSFIFNFAVGGTRDLERFREEQRSGVGDVQSRKASGSKS